MIRIRFVTGDDWVSNAIRAGERDGWCTHAETVLPDGNYLGAYIDGGVQIKPAGYDKAIRTKELIVDLDNGNGVATLGRGQLFYDFCHAQVGKPYDHLAVLGLGFGRDWRTPDSWYCSELMAAALEECGYLPKLAAADNHISPRDLLLVLSGRVPIT